MEHVEKMKTARGRALSKLLNEYLSTGEVIEITGDLIKQGRMKDAAKVAAKQPQVLDWAESLSWPLYFDWESGTVKY